MERYEKYKPSGIEWIGKIPEHWEVKKLKYIVALITEKANGDLKKVALENIQSQTGIFIESDTIFEGEGISFQKGDVLYGKLRPYLAKVWVAEFDGAAVGDFFVLRNKQMSNSDFMKFRLLSSSFTDIANSSTFGAKMPRVGWDFMSDLLFAIPPNKEQTSIASYLDRKTTEIDQIIANKQKLIALYEEEKQSVINHSVTRGVNPNVRLQPSGVEWLGDLPEHWEVKKLKWNGKIKYGLGQPPKEKADGLPIIRATNVFRGKIDKNNLVFVDPEDVPYDRDPVLKENDIIVVRSGAYTADSAIIPKEFEGSITGYDMVFRCNNGIDPVFVSKCLLSDYMLRVQLLVHTLRAAQPHLNREDLGETFIFLPPFSEQQTIVFHIEKESNRLDMIIEKCKKQIELLKEYRTTLISEVVTGKVKVME